MIMILATLCYVKKNGKTLMLHRVKKEKDIHHGKWNGLGGKLEKGETPEDCVVREVFEESGFKIKRPKMHGILLFPNFDGENDWHVFIFTASKFSGRLIDSKEGRLEWINDKDLTRLNLWEGDKVFFKWMKKGKFFSGKMLYKEEKLKSYSVSFY